VRVTDKTIHDLAAAQQGLASRQQITARGVAASVVDRRLRDGRLKAIRRGVYLVGPVGGPYMLEMAAVLGCRGDAVVAGWSAAGILDLVDAGGAGMAGGAGTAGGRPAVSGAGARSGAGTRPVAGLVRRGDSRRTDGVTARRCPDLYDVDVCHVQGVPVTSVARTLLDLAAQTDPSRLEQLAASALRQRRVSRRELEGVLSRYPRHRGARAIRALLNDAAPPAFTRSEAEARLLALLRRARLPQPKTNVRLHGFEVDAHWPGQQLVVEVDGFAFHGAEPAFHDDRRRDAVLSAAGIAVIRLTWRHVTTERDATIARLASALVQRDISRRCSCGAAVIESWE
jgi:very-short-patch-repair endonuclease